MFGFLNIYKPRGITSHDVINRLRKVLNIKKIGHAGTLDPLAQGVLPIAVSGATRLIDFLSDEKEYLADFKLGVVSKSFDCETDIVYFSDKIVCENDIKSVLKSFQGEIIQKPPIYSAIKINGRKMYELAREGENIEVKERKITVNKIILNNFDEQKQIGQLLINCSKGTYIRSIINDMGQLLNTGAIMTGLIRSKSGGFSVENSVNINDITDKKDIENKFISISEILPFPQININESQYSKVKNGNSIYFCTNNGYIFLNYMENIVALGEVFDNTIKIRKVFV